MYVEIELIICRLHAVLLALDQQNPRASTEVRKIQS